MEELTLWKNRAIRRIRQDIDNVFHRHCRNFDLPLLSDKFLHFSETEDALVLHAEIPGARPDDFDISVTENSLLIRARIAREAVEEGVGFHRIEKHTHSIRRKLTLPCRVEVESIKATFKDSTLKIFMPKCSRSSTRTIRPEIK